MSVRVVARVRPLLKTELQRDTIVSATSAAGQSDDNTATIVKIPNPKNESELYSFQFNSVYGQDATQAEIFDQEISPTVKHLFKGFDVTIFAYGVTGTGKTHTMRGGKSLADRGVIPRLLSGIYRRARRVEKESEEESSVEVVMSYYEIYNDRVYDLFEPPEKRTPAGLPIRDSNGRSVVVGLTERPCTTLKEFERLYDEANVNRSTSATKLNAHSSRSHAILCVKVTQTVGSAVRISTASAIDLAGSEDNRRTDNNKERLVESASINKSLFVLAQCVEAISRKQPRIPYRESKMTRILSLGQNNGLTIMILNLAPVRSYHLDTLSSLNFANRTKKIEVNEIENQPFFREPMSKSKLEDPATLALSVPTMNRQPLRPKILSHDSHLRDSKPNVAKPAREFMVYTDKAKPTAKPSCTANTSQARASGISGRSPKRAFGESGTSLARPAKAIRTNPTVGETSLSKEAIEALIERKVCEALADRVEQTAVSSGEALSDEVQKRLQALERRVEGQETERAEGLQYLLMAKQHQVRGEDASALTMYQLALPHFPGNEKLVRKVAVLQDRIAAKKLEQQLPSKTSQSSHVSRAKRTATDDDESYHEAEDGDSGAEDDVVLARPRTKIRHPHTATLVRPCLTSLHASKSLPSAADADSEDDHAAVFALQSPRTRQLLDIINSKDVSQIRLLKGVGAKRAEGIVNCLCDLEEDARVTTLGQLEMLKGVGVKTVESMRSGLMV